MQSDRLGRKKMKDRRNIAVAAILIALPALASAESAPVPWNAGPVSLELALEQRVQHELRTLPYYGVFDDLNFTVAGGQVTLAGKVTNPAVKADAVNALKRLSGVTGVDDQIEVLPLSDFDRSLRLKTYFAIYGYGPLEKYGMDAWPAIHILVENGHVRLTGAVNSNADRNIAFVRASGVPGVFSVTNELRVENP